jgi:predicted lipoprotein with Yx(FWY)xxD motif
MRRQHNMLRQRVIGPSLLVATALLLAACGGDDDEGASTIPAAAPEGADVAAAEIDGQSVLVNADGQALYVSDEEQPNGEVLCISDGCVAFWEPLTIDGSAPVGEVDGQLGVVARPDGANQVTFDGRPLYTFAEDSAGEINGDGLADTFDGQTLTWHVMTATGVSTTSPDEPAGPYDY